VISAITFRTAWCKDDKALEEDAKSFWRSQEKHFKLPEDSNADQRAKEHCAIAYSEGGPVGIATATLEFVPLFRTNMAVYRCAVSHDAVTVPPLSWRITEYSREVLEQWSLDNPAAKIMGLVALMTAKGFILPYPQIVAPANMVLSGFTPEGYPIRVAWFKHATIPTEWPPRPLPSRESAPPGDRSTVENFSVPLDPNIKSPKV